MNDYELRRLELKSQILSLQISDMERKSTEANSNLRKYEQSNKAAEGSWSKFLHETIRRYRAAPQQIKSQILASGLKTLADSRKIITNRKKEEQQLKGRLEQFSCTCKQKSMQLSFCQGRKQSRIALKSEINQQNINDDLVSIRAAKKKMNISADLLKKANSISKKKDKDREDCNSLKNAAEKYYQTNYIVESNLEPAVVNQTPDSEMQSWPQKNEGISLPVPGSQPASARGRSDNQPDNGQQTSKRQLKWEDAQKSYNQICNQNDQVKITVVETSQGSAVNLDYLLSPGRLISFGGVKLSESKSISLNLGASKIADRINLKENRDSLLREIRNKGLSVSDLKVGEK